MLSQHSVGSRHVVRLSLVAAITSSLSLLLAAPVLAADNATPASGDPSQVGHIAKAGQVAVLPKVTVTARKTTESLQDVPASITVINASDLAVAPLDPQIAITQNSPNLIWNTFGSTQGFYAIRGISALGAPVNNWDGTVGFNIDGVPTSMLGLSTAMLDVNRVEVLRGPQGTLWGANALGGAINVITNQPDGQRDVHLSTQIGSDGFRTGEFVAAGNLVPDTLDGRIAIQASNVDGDIRSVHTDELGARQVKAFRGGLRWTAGATSATLSANYSHDKSNSPFYLLQGAANFPISGTLTEPKQDTIKSGVTLKIEHLFEHARLTAITGYQSNRVYSYVDATDALVYSRLGIPSAFQVSSPGVTNDQEKIYSQEVRVGSLEGAATRWVAGVSAIDSDANRQWSSAGIPAYDTHINTVNLGLFADATVPLSDRWSWSMGGRINHDKSNIDVHNIADLPGSAGSNHASQNYFTGRTALNYAWNSDVTSYVSVSRGHATQIYQLYAVPVNGRLADAYPAATDWTYELGTKGDFFSHRLQVDASVYRNNVQNGVLTLLNPVTAQFQTTYQSYKTTGFELQARTLLARGLTGTTGVGYTRAILDSNSFATNRVPNIPSWTANVGLQYALPERALGVPGVFSLAADCRYVSSRVINTSNSFALSPYGLANLSAGWVSPKGSLELSAFARNLTDKRYAMYGASLSGVPVISVGEGRVVGLGATVHF